MCLELEIAPYIIRTSLFLPQQLQVKWMVGDITWELLSSCKDLEALDAYLELQGAKAP